MTPSRSPREPGMDIVRGAMRRFEVPPAQCHARHTRWGAVSAGGRGSCFRVEEAPCDGSDVIEEVDGGLCSGAVDGAGADEEPQVGVGLFR